MQILLVGGGGREHALAWALHRAGNTLAFTHANPAFAALGTVEGPDAVDRLWPDLVVVGPEQPLAEGLVDRLVARGIPAFGPTAAAARLETSKVHTKELCRRHGLPTAEFRVFRAGDVVGHLGACVVKLDGLAAGKGVWVCDDDAAAQAAVGAALAARPDAPVLVEERLEGPELSVLAICDGERVAPLPPARDHKRRFDGDHGPNTGGMGAVAPVDAPEARACVEVLRRAVIGMQADGVPFRGVLYGGFMLTRHGPMLLEFNVRFGDPECQPLMMLLAEDPAPWFLGAATGRLPDGAPRTHPGVACCVVVAGERYPEGAASAPVDALPADTDDLVVFHAGTSLRDGRLWATGGRVFGVTARGPALAAARTRAYEGAAAVRFDGADYRRDIGAWS